MTDKWTMRLNYEGLYTGINPSCEKGQRNQETTTVASREHNLKEFILSKIKPLGFNYNPLKPSKPHSSDVKSEPVYVF